MSESFELHDVDRLTVGTVGEPGERVFYLQARAGAHVVTLKLEKLQVAALADSVQEVLADLPQPGELPTDLELDEPVEPAWVVGAIGLGYDEVVDRIILLVQEVTGDDEGEEASARFHATREQVAALAIRGRLLVESGRPPCPVCGFPLDATGHVCPRLNGHRPPRR